jgi:transcriptional regulator with XRE-family HTH domain
MSALTGSRLRDRRVSLGLRQASVAQAAGLSASYLNLIEHNRRRVGGDVLARLAKVLDWPVDAFAESRGGAVVDDLLASAVLLPHLLPEIEKAPDFAGRFPGWAKMVIGLAEQNTGLQRALQSLNDRIGHDPYLSASLHEVLSAVSSVRATATILADTEDIDPQWRARFHQNLHQDSERLAYGAEALVTYLDSTSALGEQAVTSPQEEFETWAAHRDWQLHASEADIATLSSAAAQAIAQKWSLQAARDHHALPDAVLYANPSDAVQLAHLAGCDVLTAMRRIALARDAAFGLVMCDASGTLIFRKPIDGFTLPRFGSSCPLWPLFAALGRPTTPIERVVNTVASTVGALSQRFKMHAFCQTEFPFGFGGPQTRIAAMLIQLQPGPAMADDCAVGSSCRICAKADCPARNEASLLTGEAKLMGEAKDF